MHPDPTRHRIGTAGTILALALLLLLPAAVAAHAELESTIPEDGATVEGTPTEIVAVFSEALEAESSLSLRDAVGDQIARGERDPDDATRLIISPVPDLAPGDYEVRWTAATDDGHVERDTWSFTVVAPPTPAPTATPTATPEPSATVAPTDAPTPTPEPTATAAPSPSPDPGDAGASGTDVIIPIIAGLAIVAIAGGFLLRRRGRA